MRYSFKSFQHFSVTPESDCAILSGRGRGGGSINNRGTSPWRQTKSIHRRPLLILTLVKVNLFNSKCRYPTRILSCRILAKFKFVREAYNKLEIVIYSGIIYSVAGKESYQPLAHDHPIHMSGKEKERIY